MKKTFLTALVFVTAILICAAPQANAGSWPKSNVFPRFVVWQERTDIYSDPGLTTKLKFTKENEYQGRLDFGELVIALEKSRNGKSWKIDHYGDGAAVGWVPAGDFQEVRLVCCTGDGVNVRRAPVNGKIESRLQLGKNDVAAAIGYRDISGSGRWYSVFMLGDYEAWVSGKFLTLCSMPSAESARLYRQFKTAELKNNGKMESFGGIKVGAAAASLAPALRSLKNGGYDVPAELKEGKNRIAFCLRTAEPVGSRVIWITVKGGKVAEIYLDMNG
jgi:hypothetical protein